MESALPAADIELEQLTAPGIKPGPSEASLDIETEGEDTSTNLVSAGHDVVDKHYNPPPPPQRPPSPAPEKMPRRIECDFAAAEPLSASLIQSGIFRFESFHASQTFPKREDTSPNHVASEEEEEPQEADRHGEDETDGHMLLEQSIIDAIQTGKLATVKQWLEKEETKVNECRGGTASHGNFYVARGTALHWAAYYGQLEIAKLLIDKGADPRQRARGEETVLLWACHCLIKNEKLLKLLLESDKPSGENRSAGERLVNLCDYVGRTPLHYACYDNNKELLQQLLDAGAVPTASSSNCTPLDLLNEDSDEEMFDLLDKDHLLPRRSDPDLGEHITEIIENKNVNEFQQWLDREGKKVNRYRGGFAISGGGFLVQDGTAMHWAAYYGSCDIVKMLTDNGADRRVLTQAKEGVLHWACQSPQEDERVVELLLKEKQLDVNFADREGYTALHYACLRGYQKIANLLIKAGAKTTARNHYGKTPVDSARRSGKKEMIVLMDKDHLWPRHDDQKLPPRIFNAIKSGRVPTVRQWLKTKAKSTQSTSGPALTDLGKLNRCRGGKVDSDNLVVSDGTALHWAAFYGRIDIAELLLGNEADVRLMDKEGETVLHWACKSEKENDGMVKFVLDKIAEEQVDATNSSGFTALHYAGWRGHQKVAEMLKKAKADPNAKSSAGYTPVDFAFVVAGSKGTGVVEMLDRDHQLLPREDNPKLGGDVVEAIKRGCRYYVENWLTRQCHNVNHSRGGYAWSLTARYIREAGTALHWAAYYGQKEIAELLIDKGANPMARAKDNGTVLHWACTSDKENRELVKLLLNNGCKVDARDEDGNTPIHLAASQGHHGIVEDLVQHYRPCVKQRALAPQRSLNAKENEGPTPLRSASRRGHHDVVKLLVKKGVKVEPQDLMTAIDDGNERVVTDLLKSPQWPTLMRQGWGNTTPFRELIKEMPEVAKQVLHRCVVSDPKIRDPKNKDFTVVFDYSFVEDHQESGTRPVQVSSTCIPWIGPRQAGKGMEDGMDRTKASRSSTEKDTNPMMYPEDKKRAHATRFDEIQKQAEKNFTTKFQYGPSFEKSNHPLALMVRYKRLDLLTHPVISSILQQKWIWFGLWGYLLNLLAYTTFLMFLTSFALVVLSPQSTTCVQVLDNPGIAVCDQNGNGSEMMTNGTTGEGNVTCVTCELSDTRLRFVFTAGVFIILLAVLRLVLEASQFWYQLKSYLFDWVNWIEIPLYILSIIFVSVFRTTCLCPQGWQWQVGVMAILLAWLNQIVICSKFPSIGIYVIMFGKIVGSFLKVIVLSVLLVVTFGLTFYMTFSEPQFQRSPFAPPGIAFLKIMSMTAEDFSFDTVFRQSPSGESEGAQEILFPHISYILWTVFLILVPVLFTNMLIGLAVGDIQEIQNEAKLRKLALQVELILTAEDLLRLSGSHKQFISGKITVKPNHEARVEDGVSRCGWLTVPIRNVFKEFKYQLWGGERYDTLESLQEALNSQLESDSEDQKEKVKHVEAIEQMTFKIGELSGQIDTLKELIKDSESEEHREKPKDEAQAPDHVEALGNMGRMMSRMEKRMEALEELIKETSAKKGGGEESDFMRESKVGGDSEPKGSEDKSDSDN